MKLYEIMNDELNSLQETFVERLKTYCKWHRVNTFIGNKTLDIKKYNEELCDNLEIEFIGYSDDWGFGEIMNLIGITFQEDNIICHFNNVEYEDCNLEWLSAEQVKMISYDIETIIDDMENGGEIYFLNWDKYHEEIRF